ncbi:hypothetical protein EW146_g7679 [Bondarzewia mesenterica]|uniref:Uncharacterized protein n=1 Tax=Bondarzewia mesenterica TaxID=1095465 RepID=A0A4V6S1C8_9AGAM|nr:hypothetical protein EW146_g7679 [Bondarzewia mesenterica]
MAFPRALGRLTSRLAVASRSYSSRSVAGVPNPIPATFLRGGTSKGIFINRAHLPEDRSEWDPIFLGIMGSPDPEYGRQLNGMGGGVSSLSKICVVSEPSEEQRKAGIDAEYTFVQVGIRDSAVDYSGNCGNLSSMIGVFAVDERICQPRLDRNDTHIGTVRTFNTNTNKRIDNTFPVALDSRDQISPLLDLEQVVVAGVPGKASQIVLDFVSPGGARTGKLLPSGKPTDIIDLSGASSISASLIDATNPTVFITSDGLQRVLNHSAINYSDPQTLTLLERIRQSGAVRMGLDPSTQAQPKIAVLTSPSEDDADADVVIRALSMGVLHKAVPMTVGLCLGVAARVPGTVAWEIVERSRERRGVQGNMLSIKHPSGIVDVGAEFGDDGDVKSAKVKVIDYLTKQLVVSKNIITFRSLSRELGIHVNEAKNELASYHFASKDASETSYATYLISGEERSSFSRRAQDDEMDVDEEGTDDGEDAIETTILLVSEDDLENAKGRFSRIFSIHVYSLSPSPIREADLLCGTAPGLRETETKQGPELALRVGRIIGEHVQLKTKTNAKGKGVASAVASSSKAKMITPDLPKATSSLKTKEPSLTKSASSAKVSKTEEAEKQTKQEAKEVAKPKAKPKAKPIGKTDWAKAQPKDSKKESISKDGKKSGQEEMSAVKKAGEESTVKKGKPEPKRGLKRKSAVELSDSEDEKSLPPVPVKVPKPPSAESSRVKSDTRVKRRVVMSDESDEEPKPARSKSTGKSKASKSPMNDELNAMMDIGDDQVIKASRSASACKEEQDEDVEMETETPPDDLEYPPQPKTRKKKEKKVIPVGKNGLKKKHVIKSRQTVDEKGYMVTEDYSSYESVDEEEPEPEAPPKAKAKRKSTSGKKGGDDPPAEKVSAKSRTKDPVESEGSGKTKAKGRPKAGDQQNLMSFFGKTKK